MLGPGSCTCNSPLGLIRIFRRMRISFKRHGGEMGLESAGKGVLGEIAV